MRKQSFWQEKNKTRHQKLALFVPCFVFLLPKSRLFLEIPRNNSIFLDVTSKNRLLLHRGRLFHWSRSVKITRGDVKSPLYSPLLGKMVFFSEYSRCQWKNNPLNFVFSLKLRIFSIPVKKTKLSALFFHWSWEYSRLQWKNKIKRVVFSLELRIFSVPVKKLFYAHCKIFWFTKQSQYFAIMQ